MSWLFFATMWPFSRSLPLVLSRRVAALSVTRPCPNKVVKTRKSLQEQ